MSAEDFLKKFSEENGDLFYTENNNDVFDGSAGTVLRAMKEFAKQEAEKAFDAGVEYAKDCINSSWNQQRYPENNKEVYINNLFK